METYFSSPLVKSFLAGSFSGTCSTLLFQPLDLVKTRLQLSSITLGRQRSPTGILTVVVNVVRDERLSGLWRGIVPSLSRTVPGIGVYFTSLHWCRGRLGSNEPSPVELMMLGALARCVSGLTMLPLTVIKTRYECGQFQYRSMLHALTSIYHREGARGLFCGLTATLLRDAPFSGLYLMFYTQLKDRVHKRVSTGCPPSLLAHFGCGIAAGCLASLVTQPADVVKTHMQIDPARFCSLRTVVIFIYTKDGVTGFLRGIIPRTLRRSLMAAMAWTVYEQIMARFSLR